MKIVKTSDVVIVLLVCIHTLVSISCKEEVRESPTSGTLTMISSEDVFPVIDLQVQDFRRVYDQTKITHLSSSTRDAIVQLLNDSVKLIVSSRDFNAEEKQVIAKNELDVTSIKIAYDAVAVIVNENNKINKISIDELKNILTGKIDRWSKIQHSGMSSAIVAAMGEPNSGVYEYIRSRVAQNEQLMPNILPCSTSTEVIISVKERANVIGFVGISWLRNVPEHIKILEIGDPSFKQDTLSTELEYFTPHQAHIYRNYYPLSRSIYLFTHNAGKGVALGFSSFSAGNEGQKIINKTGLVPATAPVRLVQFKSQ